MRMIVLGYPVPPEVEAACLKRMRAAWFTAARLADVAWHFPQSRRPSYDASYRIADRLIQRERKAGHIVRAGKGWMWR